MIAGADIVKYLLSAGGLALAFLIAAIALQARGRSTRARRLVLVLAIAFVVVSNYAFELGVGRLLIGSLRPLEASDVPKGGRTAVVVLGSGTLTVESWTGARYAVPDRPSAARILETVRVYQLINPDVIISSGGEPHPRVHHEPSGNVMRDALVALGVPRARIVVETKSTTTRDEAMIVAPMVKSLGVDRVVLVTSGTHMRRSLGTFRSVGIQAIPAIARELEPIDSWTLAILPNNDGLDAGSANLHEALGIVYYWLRGWWMR